MRLSRAASDAIAHTRKAAMIHELHPDEIESVLHRHHVGRLACVLAGEPYLVPITYTYQDRFIYGHTLPGQKLDAMRAEPRVSFEVDERWETDVWRSVVVRGVFEELTTENDQDVALAALHGVFPDASRAMEGGVLFRIRPTATTGRAVQRSELFSHFPDAERSLLGIDLRAGDDANFPSSDDV
jgi:nitroimidazol reductase NimA-like FMN-containing flavoprotein (pyridoxamine 5'-phosphate oxidase superfamily)